MAALFKHVVWRCVLDDVASCPKQCRMRRAIDSSTHPCAPCTAARLRSARNPTTTADLAAPTTSADLAAPTTSTTSSASKPDACDTPDKCVQHGDNALLNDRLDAAEQAYAWACEHGAGAACSRLATMLHSGALAPDQPRFVALHLRGCALGHAPGCREAGVAHHKGDGVTHDPRLALKLFRKACAAKDASGCYFAGLLLARGEGASTDPKQALKYLDRACTMAEAVACDDAGALLYRGEGVAQDPSGAVRRFNKACDLDARHGCFNLAVATLHGRGVKRDRKRAVMLLHRACAAGQQRACTAVEKLVARSPTKAAAPSAGVDASSR